MSNLTLSEKSRFEKILNMESGYVLDFSNRTFQLFVSEAIEINIYDKKYAVNGESKANRLRTLWSIEKPHIVGKLLIDLIEHWEFNKLRRGDITHQEEKLASNCKKISKVLIDKHEVDDVEVLAPIARSQDHWKLFEEVKATLNRDEPEKAMDRLHTHMVHIFRELCKKHNLNYDKKTSLHALYGSYVKKVRKKTDIQSELSLKIMKSPISLLESFNHVRNNQSYAHDVHILSKPEAYLIVSIMINVIRFVKHLEKEIAKTCNNEYIAVESMPSDEEIEAAGDLWMQMQLDIQRGK